jgi:hypothetical protein
MAAVKSAHCNERGSVRSAVGYRVLEGPIPVAQQNAYTAPKISDRQAQVAVVIEVRGCHPVGYDTRRIRNRRLEGAVSVSQKNLHLATCNRYVQFAIVIEIADSDVKGGDCHCGGRASFELCRCARAQK